VEKLVSRSTRGRDVARDLHSFDIGACRFPRPIVKMLLRTRYCWPGLWKKFQGIQLLPASISRRGIAEGKSGGGESYVEKPN